MRKTFLSIIIFTCVSISAKTSATSSTEQSDEAERHMVRGGAAFKDATSETNYREAAKEFDQVTLLAPWSGDAYFNLGVAQDKANSPKAFVASLEGAKYVCPEFRREDDAWQVEINIKDGMIAGNNVVTDPLQPIYS